MAEAHFWRPANRNLAPRSAQRIRIIVRHHNDPEGRFAPQHTTCSDDPEKGRKGCGGSIVFYRTYPKEARMPFDGPPIIVDETLVGSMVVATVETDNVHFATCTERKRAEPVDGKTRAIGG